MRGTHEGLESVLKSICDEQRHSAPRIFAVEGFRAIRRAQNKARPL